MPDLTPDTARPARGPLWKWWVCGLLLLATMLNYMDRQTINFTATRIMAELRLEPRDYGQLESVFAYAFAVGAIVFGWLADRWNVTWLYPFALLAWSAAGFATGLVSSFAALMLCRFLLGLAEAGHWPCALRTTQIITPPHQRTTGNSLLQSGAALGAILTPIVVRLLVLEGNPGRYPEWVAQATGGLAASSQASVPFPGLVAAAVVPVYQPGAWRWPFLVVGAVGVSWVALWLLSVRRRDLAVERRPSPSLVNVLGWLVLLLGADLALQVAQSGNATAARGLHGLGLEPATLRAPWLTLAVKLGVSAMGITAVARWFFRSTGADAEGERLPRRTFVRRFWVLVVLVVTINATWHFFRAWLPLFLQVERRFSESDANWAMQAYYIATDLGSLTAGFATLLLARGGMTVHASRVWVFAACATLTTLSVSAALVGNEWLMMGLLLMVGFGALGLYPNYYSFTQELTVRHQGKVSGSLGCITWLSSYAMQAAVGESVQTLGYSAGVALAGLPPLIGLAALLLLWGKEEPQPSVATKSSA